MSADADRDQISSLRAMAHPVRVRILSLLTAEAMSAAEVARALDLTHANASYHLRVLHEAGELVIESQEKVRGGMAKRYRYDITRDLTGGGTPAVADRLADARAWGAELERRLLDTVPGASYASDLEAWVPVDTWHRALDLLYEASSLLHAAARPVGSPDTVHVSATTQAFTMAGGLHGAAVRWRP